MLRDTCRRGGCSVVGFQVRVERRLAQNPHRLSSVPGEKIFLIGKPGSLALLWRMREKQAENKRITGV